MSLLFDLKSVLDKGYDDPFAVAHMAVYLSSITRPGVSGEKYISHFRIIADDTKQRFRALREAGAADDLNTRLAALKHVLYDKYDYRLAPPGHEIIQSNDITYAVDSRVGADVILAILYITAAKAQGWHISGINFPGRFLCALSEGGKRLIFDPSQLCKIMLAPDLRHILKQVDSNMELSTSYYADCVDADMLIVLQNRIKTRQIECEDYQGAVKSVEAMRIIAPTEPRLLLEAGVLYMRTGNHGKARGILNKYLDVAPSLRDRQEALAIMQHLRPDDQGGEQGGGDRCDGDPGENQDEE